MSIDRKRQPVPPNVPNPQQDSPAPVPPPAGGPGNETGGKKEAKKGSMEHLVRISAIGSNFAFAVMGMGLLGWALEKWVWPGAAPWLLIAGLGLGLIGGLVRFVRDALAAERNS